MQDRVLLTLDVSSDLIDVDGFKLWFVELISRYIISGTRSLLKYGV